MQIQVPQNPYASAAGQSVVKGSSAYANDGLATRTTTFSMRNLNKPSGSESAAIVSEQTLSTPTLSPNTQIMLMSHDLDLNDRMANVGDDDIFSPGGTLKFNDDPWLAQEQTHSNVFRDLSFDQFPTMAAGQLQGAASRSAQALPFSTVQSRRNDQGYGADFSFEGLLSGDTMAQSSYEKLYGTQAIQGRDGNAYSQSSPTSASLKVQFAEGENTTSTALTDAELVEILQTNQAQQKHRLSPEQSDLVKNPVVSVEFVHALSTPSSPPSLVDDDEYGDDEEAITDGFVFPATPEPEVLDDRPVTEAKQANNDPHPATKDQGPLDSTDYSASDESEDDNGDKRFSDNGSLYEDDDQECEQTEDEEVLTLPPRMTVGGKKLPIFGGKKMPMAQPNVAAKQVTTDMVTSEKFTRDTEDSEHEVNAPHEDESDQEEFTNHPTTGGKTVWPGMYGYTNGDDDNQISDTDDSDDLNDPESSAEDDLEEDQDNAAPSSALKRHAGKRPTTCKKTFTKPTSTPRSKYYRTHPHQSATENAVAQLSSPLVQGPTTVETLQRNVPLGVMAWIACNPAQTAAVLETMVYFNLLPPQVEQAKAQAFGEMEVDYNDGLEGYLEQGLNNDTLADAYGTPLSTKSAKSPVGRAPPPATNSNSRATNPNAISSQDNMEVGSTPPPGSEEPPVHIATAISRPISGGKFPKNYTPDPAPPTSNKRKRTDDDVVAEEDNKDLAPLKQYIDPNLPLVLSINHATQNPNNDVRAACPYPAPPHILLGGREMMYKNFADARDKNPTTPLSKLKIPWTIYEDDQVIKHMLAIRLDASIPKSEKRFGVVSARMAEENQDHPVRTANAIKCMWARVGRVRSGFDERKPGRQDEENVRNGWRAKPGNERPRKVTKSSVKKLKVAREVDLEDEDGE